MIIRDTLLWGAEQLKRAEIQEYRKEAEMLLSACIDRNRLWLYMYPEITVSEQDFTPYRKSICKRAERIPIQHILGRCDFMHMELLITPDVFIPRPETELVVEEAISRVKSYELGVMSKNKRKNSELRTHNSELRILDLCTGSGCIAIALARRFSEATVIATDISQRALKIAKINAERYGVEDKITFLAGDLFEPLTHYISYLDTYDLIISNPPYIPTDDIPYLQAEVAYDPQIAINGGKDGLCYLRRISKEAHRFLKSGGYLILEIGDGQAGNVFEMLDSTGRYESPEVSKDIAGIDRIITAKKREWKR
ncbi:MAG: peptide chain release factor N(5)-glutamine methyltransferase [Nitrospirota bacterium]